MFLQCVLPARRITAPLAVVLPPCRFDLVQAQLIGQKLASTGQRDGKCSHHPFAAMFDRDRPHRHADVLAAQREEPDHIRQFTPIQLAGIAVEVVAEWCAHLACRASFGGLRTLDPLKGIAQRADEIEIGSNGRLVRNLQLSAREPDAK